MNEQPSALVLKLYAWSETITRDLPWKDSRDPYRIWLSEIILQQTRVAQGRPYWLRFVDRFPTVDDLAAASRDEVYKVWEGLGYYSRARNLHAAARMVSEDMDGVFPDTYDGLLALPGVGPYTAAAVASFAYDLPQAVVDGNVMRVITRLFDSHLPIDTTEGKRTITALVDDLLDIADPARFNQAIMDFGALQCVPKKPDCTNCPLQKDCLAYDKETVSLLPVKAKKTKKRKRFFHYVLLLDQAQRTIIRQRPEGDVWAGLFEWPLIEMDTLGSPVLSDWSADLSGVPIRARSKVFKQTLSHQHIHTVVTIATVIDLEAISLDGGKLVQWSDMAEYALPRLIRTAITELEPVVQQLQQYLY